MKTTQSCVGAELSSAVTYLGTYGMVASGIGAMLILGILGIINQPDQVYSGAMYGGGIFLLLIEIGWFLFSCLLLKINENSDIKVVRKMIKIVGYITVVFLAVSSAVIGIIIVASFGDRVLIVAAATGPVLFCLFIACILLFGLSFNLIYLTGMFSVLYNILEEKEANTETKTKNNVFIIPITEKPPAYPNSVTVA
eukprot:GFUD01043639.1.p1 GENE.GFUD01043639.1~~GFUD01043639.1.p1  ORF type:complete len:196 (+),score=41.85 GFUD01043639.1:124-711(+)